jgi:hypothetical protein
MSELDHNKEPLSPLLDISSIIAVQSLFGNYKNHQDPWGARDRRAKHDGIEQGEAARDQALDVGQDRSVATVDLALAR